MAEKPVIWLGTARDDVRGFPADARQVAGFQLSRVQTGLDPNDWKPMPAVGLGVREVRVHTGLEHRILYLATFDEAVLRAARVPEALAADPETGPGTRTAASP